MSDLKHHHHHHHHHAGADQTVGRLFFAFVLNLSFAVIEVIGGVWTGSVSIVADAVHDLGDSVSLGLALYLQKKSLGHPTPEFSYGYRRLSLMSAVITGFVLVCGSALIGVEAARRLIEGSALPNGGGMLAFAVLGVTVNGLAALRLGRGHSHNEKMLTWHMIEDVLGWSAVLVGAAVIWATGWSWVDPLMGVAIALFVSWNAMRNLLKSISVFLQRVPDGVDSQELRRELTAILGVEGVHDLHIWSLDGEHHVVTLHAIVSESMDRVGIKKLIREVAQKFGSIHTTIELESTDDVCTENCEAISTAHQHHKDCQHE